MRAYLDNMIVSGKVRGDLEPAAERIAVEKIDEAERNGRLEIVTSRESWREQDRAQDASLRARLQEARPNVAVVTNDHKLLGFHFQADHLGGFVTYPLISDLTDEPLFLNLKKHGLKDADARHLMYAVCNDCDRFITTDPDFLDRRPTLGAFCGKLLISKPSDLVAELSL